MIQEKEERKCMDEERHQKKQKEQSKALCIA